MISNLKKHLINIPGARTNKKIVVFESDDWGSIRMPSKIIYDKLEKKYSSVTLDPYLKYDSLASNEDICHLYEVLDSVKDSNGNPCKITANAVMGNPDFENIASNGFEKYYWESFEETWNRYPKSNQVKTLWQEGLENKFLKFQCHGREHLNVFQWMKSLKERNKDLHIAFENKMISISSLKSKMRFGYMEGLDFFSDEELLHKEQILRDSLEIFEEYFAYKSKSFIANCYIWSKQNEITLSNCGVKYIQGISNQIVPVIKDGQHFHIYKKHYLGQKNEFNQKYIVRNAFFEPSLDSRKDWVSDCLKRIKIAFKWGKPAVIGSHRLNFIGSIVESNRTNNLRDFKSLLNKIIKTWPDTIFLSSDELFENM